MEGAYRPGGPPSADSGFTECSPRGQKAHIQKKAERSVKAQARAMYQKHGSSSPEREGVRKAAAQRKPAADKNLRPAQGRLNLDR